MALSVTKPIEPGLFKANSIFVLFTGGIFEFMRN